jgi:hypothetical protein
MFRLDNPQGGEGLKGLGLGYGKDETGEEHDENRPG